MDLLYARDVILKVRPRQDSAEALSTNAKHTRNCQSVVLKEII